MDQEVVSTFEAARDVRTYEYFILSAFSFLIYDHIITIGDEINYFWRRPITQSSVWFFLNRYVAFFGNIVAVTLEWVDFPPEKRLMGCFVFNLFREIILIANLLIVSSLLIMRTYALYNRSKAMLAFLLITFATLVGIALWFTFGSNSESITDPNLRGCYTGLTLPTAIRYAAAFEANFLFDTIIFCLTMFRTWKGRSSLRVGGRSVSLVAIMLRDGAMYYGAMVLVNLSTILTTYFARPYLRGCTSTFSSGMCVTLMSRLMLNLHVGADSVYVHNDYHLPSSQRPTAQAQSIELKAVWPGQQDSQGTATFTGTGTVSFQSYEKPHRHPYQMKGA